MSDALKNPTLESLAAEMRQLRERLEDMEDLLELREAVERNGGKPGMPWEQVKAELDIDRHTRKEKRPQGLEDTDLAATTQSGNLRAMSDKRIYVERRPEGDYAVRRPGSERASAVEPTQRKAIERARELEPGVDPHVERVRDTSAGNRDKWRRP